MNDYNPTPALTRALFAVASLVFSALVLGSMAGLAAHYGDQAQLAGSAAQVVAQR
jgi:hypothetical protein